jgi:hypothetical protein
VRLRQADRSRSTSNVIERRRAGSEREPGQSIRPSSRRADRRRLDPSSLLQARTVSSTRPRTSTRARSSPSKRSGSRPRTRACRRPRSGRSACSRSSRTTTSSGASGCPFVRVVAVRQDGSGRRKLLQSGMQWTGFAGQGGSCRRGEALSRADMLRSGALSLLRLRRLLDIVHSEAKLYLVFEFLDMDLKKYMDTIGSEDGLGPALVKVRFGRANDPSWPSRRPASWARSTPLRPADLPTHTLDCRGSHCSSSRASTTVTPTGSSTAISSPRTCSSTRTATSSSPTLGSPGRLASRSGRTPTRYGCLPLLSLQRQS